MALPVNLVRGEDVYLIDSEGRRYLSFAESINILGYSNETIKREMIDQIGTLVHYTNELSPYRECMELGESLLKEMGTEGGYIFTSSGSEANEYALSRLGVSSRRKIIGIRGAYHGQLHLTGAITNAKRMKEITLVSPDESGIDKIDGLLKQDMKTVIIIEPLMIHAGIRPLPRYFVDYLSKLASSGASILISDEVYLSPAKTGFFYGYQSINLRPHVITLGKSLGGGLPLGAVLFTRDVGLTSPLGITTTSQGGNRTACRAGVALLKELRKMNLIERVRQNGERVRKLLTDELLPLKQVTDVRGIGYIYGVELEKKFVTSTNMNKIISESIRRGLLISLMGERNEVVRLAPPLVATLNHWERAVEILRDILSDLR